ncbi:hypothetical protein ACHQM5_026093 [Ranunculus cassubicifolius]
MGTKWDMADLMCGRSDRQTKGDKGLKVGCREMALPVELSKLNTHQCMEDVCRSGGKDKRLDVTGILLIKVCCSRPSLHVFMATQTTQNVAKWLQI